MQRSLVNNLLYKLVSNSRDAYEEYLRLAINENHFNLIDSILEKIVIPDRALYWLAVSNNADFELMKKFFTKKLQCDAIIDEFRDIFQKDFYADMCTVDILEGLVKKHFPHDSGFYRFRLVQLLIGNDNYLNIERHSKQYPTNNIFSNYNDIYWSIDKAVCEAVYYTQSNFLFNLYRVINRNGLEYKLEPHVNMEHKQLLQWVEDNISKAQHGTPLGWRSGPDSARWPSTSPEDYTKTLDIVKKYYL